MLGVATDTDNDLNKELEGYENIVVAEPIAVISQDLANRLDNVPRGYGTSDCILFCLSQALNTGFSAKSSSLTNVISFGCDRGGL